MIDRRAYTAAGASAVLAGGLGYVALVDPHNPGSAYPQCPFKWLTGWNCPFCGGLRMTHDLLHGDLMAAVNDNAFLLVCLVIGIPLTALWVQRRRRRPDGPPLPMPVVWTILCAMAVWTVVRNLPGFPLMPTVTG